MIKAITDINKIVNDFIWGVPAMICIIGVGLILSCRTKFIQVRKFGHAMKMTIGQIFVKKEIKTDANRSYHPKFIKLQKFIYAIEMYIKKLLMYVKQLFEKKDTKEGTMSPFQAVCTALAATVGTGNIAGVAGAIALGGPGAVFWMWISALLGMCTKFAEVTLAVHFREKNKHEDYVGGPMYYIKNGLGKKWIWLAYIFAGLGILTVFGTGNATQVQTITTAINSALTNYNLVSEDGLATSSLIIGIIITILIGIILLGGIKRIGKVTEKLVPFMALLYIILGVGVVVLNIQTIPSVFKSIFVGAFNPQAFTGGLVGSFFVSMKRGVSRGIFSNEAGLGTGSIAHACADTDEPVKQGMFGIFEVFTDTIVICTLTALVILCSGTAITFGSPADASLTISGFVVTYGKWISIFTAIALCCFAFSTILGWGLYGARCLEFICGEKVIKPFMIVYSLVAIVGATADLGLIWGIADTCNGLMAIPNLIALFLLSGTVVKLTKQYFKK